MSPDAGAFGQIHQRRILKDLSISADYTFVRGLKLLRTEDLNEPPYFMVFPGHTRTQAQAAALVAQVVARVREVPIFLTDGWKAYSAALLQVLGVVYRRRRRGKVGRKPKPRLVAPNNLFYAQVVKVRNQAGQVVEVRRRVVFGGPRRFVQQLRLRELGTTIQTAFIVQPGQEEAVDTGLGQARKKPGDMIRVTDQRMTENPAREAERLHHILRQRRAAA